MATVITSIDRHLSLNPIAKPTIDRASLRQARADWAAARVLVGASNAAPPLLTDAEKPEPGQTKFSQGEGERIVGLTLSPATEMSQIISQIGDLDVSNADCCDHRTVECTKLCLKGTGRQAFDYAALARAARTAFLIRTPDSFATLMVHELVAAARKFGPLAFRPDVLSDLSWDRIMPWLADMEEIAVVYGYTKNLRKARRWAALDGWSVTFSASERTDAARIRQIVGDGINVAVAVDATKKDAMPATWAGIPVVNGDSNDRRHLDPAGSVVLLRVKVGMGNRSAVQSTTVSINSFVKPLAA